MAKSAPSATFASAGTKGRFRVVVKGYPIMGYVDTDQRIYPRPPVAVHYRQRKPDDEGNLIDGWCTERVLREEHGLQGEISKDFQRRKRVRTDLTPALFAGAVVEADTDYEAREVFSRAYGLRDTASGNWSVQQTADSDPVGPCGPTKMRGLLVQRDAGAA